jgi:hypothetical protein
VDSRVRRFWLVSHNFGIEKLGGEANWEKDGNTGVSDDL